MWWGGELWGEDEHEANATRMDDWIVWEVGGRDAACNFTCTLFFHLNSIICKGDPYSENGAQRGLAVEDFLCMGYDAGAAPGLLCNSLHTSSG
jgi:hypothetical protein